MELCAAASEDHPSVGCRPPLRRGYAQRQGRTVEEFLGGASLTPADVGADVLRLLQDRTLDEQVAFGLDPSGLAPVR
jgi:hypothetical protein